MEKPQHEHKFRPRVIDHAVTKRSVEWPTRSTEHADEAYDELPDDRRQLIAEKMFKALTEKGEDNREIRRPVEFPKLCAVAEPTR